MSDQNVIVFATSNAHKIDEVAAILAPLGVRVVGLDAIDCHVPEPVEDGETFEANAAIKARYYAAETGRACLADDSGLAVDALDGAPGVYSARYAGIGDTRPARDQANNEKLLRELQDVPPAQRQARFVCAMCLANPDGSVIATSRGEFAGTITDAPRGENGFGYDPLLELADGRTSAELPPEEKNARSHRGAATRQLAETLSRLQSTP